MRLNGTVPPLVLVRYKIPNAPPRGASLWGVIIPRVGSALRSWTRGYTNRPLCGRSPTTKDDVIPRDNGIRVGETPSKPSRAKMPCTFDYHLFTHDGLDAVRAMTGGITRP